MGRNEAGKLELSVGATLGLAVATLVVTAIVFVFGVYVGKGIAERRIAGSAEIVRLPVESEGQATGEVEETFWERLGEGEGGETEVPAEPTPTEVAIRVAPPATPQPAATVPSTPVPPTPVPPTPAATTAPVVEVPESEELPPGEWFQVQLTALADRDAALRLVRELGNEGLDARLVEGEFGGRPLYRVRVGRYATRVEAEREAARLEARGYSQPFVVAGE